MFRRIQKRCVTWGSFHFTTLKMFETAVSSRPSTKTRGCGKVAPQLLASTGGSSDTSRWMWSKSSRHPVLQQEFPRQVAPKKILFLAKDLPRIKSDIRFAQFINKTVPELNLKLDVIRYPCNLSPGCASELFLLCWTKSQMKPFKTVVQHISNPSIVSKLHQILQSIHWKGSLS